jgi:hypothetical protein
MQIGELINRWSYCYHVTALANLVRVRELGRLVPAADLLRAASRVDLIAKRRTEDIALQVGGREVLVRNQIPLNPTALHLECGLSLREYVAYLNSMVFLWPGTELGPSADCFRMFLRSANTVSALLRVPTRSLVETNGSATVRVSTCNAGATWFQDGKRSSRSIDILQAVDQHAGDADAITELSYPHDVRLPVDVEYALSPAGPWRGLKDSASTPSWERWSP